MEIVMIDVVCMNTLKQERWNVKIKMELWLMQLYVLKICQKLNVRVQELQLVWLVTLYISIAENERACLKID